MSPARAPALAVVTGAGSETGIGFAVAQRLAAAGHAVLLAGLSQRVEDRAHDLQRSGAVAAAFRGDLADESEVTRLAEFARSFAQPVAILVNNAGMAVAGVLDASGPVAELGLSEWNVAIARNLTSAFLVSRAFVSPMCERGYGRIVNVASTTGPLMAMPDDAGYAAAKAGMAGFTRALAVEVASRGVTVNAVAPGWIATGSQSAAEAAAGRATPVGRSGTAAEVAAVVAFLCTADAGYVTGQLIVVDGGNSVIETRSAAGANHGPNGVSP